MWLGPQRRRWKQWLLLLMMMTILMTMACVLHIAHTKGRCAAGADLNPAGGPWHPCTYAHHLSYEPFCGTWTFPVLGLKIH